MSRPPRLKVTSAAKPCSARSASNAAPPSSAGAGTRGPEPIFGRTAGPSSTSRMSVRLSTSVVIVRASTGSRAIGSTSGMTQDDRTFALRRMDPAGLEPATYRPFQ